MLNGILSPIFSGMHPVVFIITLVIMMMVLTNIGSNMATGVVLMTVIIPFVGDYYFSPSLVGMIIISVSYTHLHYEQGILEAAQVRGGAERR